MWLEVRSARRKWGIHSRRAKSDRAVQHAFDCRRRAPVSYSTTGIDCAFMASIVFV